jgi:hypothetical protein
MVFKLYSKCNYHLRKLFPGVSKGFPTVVRASKQGTKTLRKPQESMEEIGWKPFSRPYLKFKVSPVMSAMFETYI